MQAIMLDNEACLSMPDYMEALTFSGSLGEAFLGKSLSLSVSS